MFSPLALVLIPAGYLFLWPLADRLLGKPSDPGGGTRASPLPIALTGMALSVGALGWLLFGVGLLRGRLLAPLTALLIVLAGLVLGLALNPAWFAPRRWSVYWRRQWERLVRLDAGALLTLTILGSLFVILVHDLYYPFIGDDTLIRYGRQAQAIYQARRFPTSVSGYPPLAPLSFVATWFAAGGPNEHLARLFPFAMAAGTLGATYLLGRHLWGRLEGLLAAALVAVSPVFVNNATLAYTDIPTAFPLMLALFYVALWWDSGRIRDALLGGILLGVALFTKQSALTWLASLSLIPFLRFLASSSCTDSHHWRRVLAGLAAVVLPPLLIAGPWYLRNILLDSWANAIPIAGLFHLRLPRTGWLGLAPSLAWPREFGFPLSGLYALGWVMGLAAAAGQGWRVLHRRVSTLPPDLLLAAAAVPYWLAWWVSFSFDARFLLLILPLMALWTARPLGWAFRWLADHTRLPRPWWQIGGSLLWLGLLLVGTRERLGGVYRAVTHPFASDMERLRAAKGPLADLIVYARTNLDPDTDRLCLMDERLAYYLGDFQIDVGFPLKLSDLEGCDYLFHVSSIHTIYGEELGWEDSEFYRYAFSPDIFEPVYESGGVYVMRVLYTYVPWEQEGP